MFDQISDPLVYLRRRGDEEEARSEEVRRLWSWTSTLDGNSLFTLRRREKSSVPVNTAAHTVPVRSIKRD